MSSTCVAIPRFPVATVVVHVIVILGFSLYIVGVLVVVVVVVAVEPVAGFID
jgi:hypothetical protein